MKNVIKKRCFSLDWIKKQKKLLSTDPVLIEKTIHAFALLGYLSQIESGFVFKGGTSLLLHTRQIRRLSIDIDIIFGGNIEEFKLKLKTITGNFPFTKFEEDQRGDRGLPNRCHFKFFYNSSISAREDTVLLDIVLTKPTYIAFLEEKEINCPFFETENDISLKVPTIEGLMGDKLTAFAPHTIGIPFQTSKGISMTMQIAKQLFDLGELFNIATNFENIVSAFKKTFKQENSYHEKRYKESQVLQDMIDTSIDFCHLRLKGASISENAVKIEDGIKRLSSHLVRDKFRVETEAKIAAAKIFFLANAINNNHQINLEEIKYTSNKIKLIRNAALLKPYEKLNRLKPVLPEAFYYIWLGVKK
jgi:hypothetical protein